jgi:hypothetical protein
MLSAKGNIDIALFLPSGLFIGFLTNIGYPSFTQSAN